MPGIGPPHDTLQELLQLRVWFERLLTQLPNPAFVLGAQRPGGPSFKFVCRARPSERLLGTGATTLVNGSERSRHGA